jgi:hypothetical protein
MIVKATREGLKGKKTSSGYIVDDYVPFVALPSHKALGKFVRIVNYQNNKTCIAVVLDVGPWNEHDDAYVFDKARPLAEQGISKSMKGTNNAGIDLGKKVWDELGMIENSDVDWGFIT